MTDDAADPGGAGDFSRALAGQVGDPADPGQMGLGSRRVGRDDAVGEVKAARGEFDHRAADLTVAQWRSAGRAEITLGDRR